MTNLTLKQLRYFEALTRHGRFRLAADACAISQPALSMQIKELEEELGNDLFERSARDVKLTAFGEIFSHRVRDVLRAVDELGELARAARNPFLARLRIGIIPTDPPVVTMMKWGPHCDYSGGAIDLFNTKSPEADLNRVLELTKGGKQRVPVQGIGQRAFFTTVYPDDPYRRRGLLAIYLPDRILAVSMDPKGEDTPESTKPKIEELAKLVMARVK